MPYSTVLTSECGFMPQGPSPRRRAAGGTSPQRRSPPRSPPRAQSAGVRPAPLHERLLVAHTGAGQIS
eukprot:441826-Prymnesium_polylepis.1